MSNFTRKIIKQDNLRFRDSLGIDSPFLDKFFTKNTLKENIVTKKVRVVEVIPINISQDTQLIGLNNENVNLFTSQQQNVTGLNKVIYVEESDAPDAPSKDSENFIDYLSTLCLGYGGGFFFTNESISPDTLVEVQHDETDRNAPVKLLSIVSNETVTIIEAAKNLFDSKNQSGLTNTNSKNPSVIEGLQQFKGAHVQEFQDLSQKSKLELTSIGLSGSTLRKDAALLFQKAKKEIQMQGAELNSVGGFVTTKKGGPSLHYLGLAHDFATNSGFQNTNKNNFIIVYEGNKQWTVYAKSSLSSIVPITVNATIGSTTNGSFSMKEVPYTGRLVNVTKIMAKYGFVPISAKNGSHPPYPNYGQYTAPKGAKYDSTEWWHFQLSLALKPGDLYGDQLLKIMTENEAKKIVSTFGNWDEVKNYRYGQEFR